jgi:hypothetical protein
LLTNKSFLSTRAVSTMHGASFNVSTHATERRSEHCLPGPDEGSRLGEVRGGAKILSGSQVGVLEEGTWKLGFEGCRGV